MLLMLFLFLLQLGFQFICCESQQDTIALLSYPHSGTTWLKFLYESITNLQSASVYGEPVGIISTSKNPLLFSAPGFIKDHYPYSDTGLQTWFSKQGNMIDLPERNPPQKWANRFVVLIRDPYTNIISRYIRDSKKDTSYENFRSIAKWDLKKNN